MIDNNVRNLLTDLNIGFVDPIIISNLTPKGEKMNVILKVQSNNLAAILKLYEVDQPLMGEETVKDSLYDSYVHFAVSTIFKEFGPSRNILAYDFTSNNKVKRPFLMQTYLNYPLLKDIDDRRLLGKVHMDFVGSLCDFYKSFGVNSVYGYASAFEKISENVVPEYKSNMLQYVLSNDGTSDGYADFASKYFIADIKREARLTQKDQLLNSVYELIECLRIDTYSLVHADLKPQNLLQDKDHLIPFDWSRSHYGDPALDIADILVSQMVYYPDKTILNKIVEFVSNKNGSIPSSMLNQRLIFFASFKLFSIARVFYPELLDIATNGIISNYDKSIVEFLIANNWVVGKYF